MILDIWIVFDAIGYNAWLQTKAVRVMHVFLILRTSGRNPLECCRLCCWDCSTQVCVFATPRLLFKNSLNRVYICFSNMQSSHFATSLSKIVVITTVLTKPSHFSSLYIASVAREIWRKFAWFGEIHYLPCMNCSTLFFQNDFWGVCVNMHEYELSILSHWFFFLILHVVFKADTGTSFGLVLMDLQQVTVEYLSAASYFYNVLFNPMFTWQLSFIVNKLFWTVLSICLLILFSYLKHWCVSIYQSTWPTMAESGLVEN